MAGKKLTIIDYYKLIGIALLFITMVILQFHREDGKWKPITPPNEWWTIMTGCLVYTFMKMYTVSEKMLQIAPLEHAKGIIWTGLLFYLGISYYFAIPISKEVMAAVGAVQGFLYGSS